MIKPTHPAQWAINFLEWFCPDALFEGVLGDLLEQFDDNEEEWGSGKAKRLFVWNIIRFFRPGIILRNKFKLKIINSIMFTSYLKIALRNILKRKLYSFINAFGLSIAIAFCVLIYLFIKDEASFDQFHANKEQLYRLDSKTYDTWQHDPENPYNKSAYLQIGLAPVVSEEVPQVKSTCRYSEGSGIVKYNEKVFHEGFTYVDGGFFNMFSFPLISGDADRLFLNKYEVVITPEIVDKYFNGTDPIGKILELDITGTYSSYTVTGVITPAPPNSSLEYNILLPQQNRPYYDKNVEQWGNFSTPTFIQLVKGADLEQFRANMDAVVEKYMKDKTDKWRLRGNVPDGIKMLEYYPVMFTDMHLNTEVAWHKSSDPQYSLILGGIAILILLIACINYVSMALTTSASRKKEVGVRKAIGANKGQLISQFAYESVSLAFISLVIGLGLMMLFLPYFNDFTDKGIELGQVNWVELTGMSIVLTITIGLLAGSYPSFFLSSFQPTHVLRGGFTSKLHAGFARPLVVLQFALSAFLIISSVIMYRQMNYITTKDLGYNKDQILVVPTHAGWNAESNKMVERMQQKMQQIPGVGSVAGASLSFNQGYSRYGYKVNEEQKSAYVYAVEPNYIPLLGINVAEGRNFDANIRSDSNAIIVNRTLVADMGWENPLEEHLNWREDSASLGSRVIGVVDDYHFLSLERTIEPMFLSLSTRDAGYLTSMMIKVNANDIPATMEKIRAGWKELSPDKPFDYTFLDEDVAKQYESYERWMKIMGMATAFGILISCLGLFGLAGINAMNRTREIGIRKVFGAELINIFILLNRQYILLAIIAFALATPVAWYIMHLWLSDFQFAIKMGWELFAGSMAGGLILALITVSYHAIKTAHLNPVDSLKYE